MLDKFQGCLLGSTLGDALCADREGGLFEQLLWRLIGRTRQGLRRWTDDTQMSIDLARHLVREGCVAQDKLAAEFAAAYRWSRGYGPGTVAVLKQIKAGMDWKTAATVRHPSGSFGNGAAMRIAPVALFFHDRQEELEQAVVQASVITHPHPAAIAGAQLIAQAVVQALRGAEPAAAVSVLAEQCSSKEYVEKMETVTALLAATELPEPVRLRQLLGMESTALRSCPTAVLLGLRFQQQPFPELIDYVRRCGGDTDTVGAMSGAIWGAANGVSRIPEQLLCSVEDHLELLRLAEALHGI